jgi:hypothetical protein
MSALGRKCALLDAREADTQDATPSRAKTVRKEVDGTDPYEVEPDADTTSGICECCGNVSRQLTGFIHQGDATVAGYSIHWTVGHFPQRAANIDLVLGRWGEDAGPDQRSVVSLEIIERGGQPEVKVIDAGDRPIAGKTSLAQNALARSQVIGTPIAQQALGLVDAIFERDPRLAALME